MDAPQPGRSDSMDSPDMDQLMTDIREFLRQSDETPPAEETAPLQGEIEATPPPAPGSFLPSGDPHVMARVGAAAKAASYVVEGLTVVLLAMATTVTWSSWPTMLLALGGILTAGLVGSMLLVGTHARIALLVDIEGNTRRIARNKERIARLLERVWIA